MDRNKPSSGTRGPKSKITQQPPDMFIALGAKSSSSRDVDIKRNVPIIPKSSTSGHLSVPTSKGLPERKRESMPVPSLPPAKKLKVLPGRPPGGAGPSLTTILPERSLQIQNGAEPWESLALETESPDLLMTIIDNATNGNMEKAVGYVLGAIRTLKLQRFKPDKIVYDSILLACQIYPTIFENENVAAALIGALRREAAIKNPNKTNGYQYPCFINILQHAYSEINHWPEIFLKFYVEDAVSDRIWIDNIYCKPFVDNIITAFNTKQPPKSLLSMETWMPTVRETGSPLTIISNEDDEASNEQRIQVESWNVRPYPRYNQSQEIVEQIVLEAITEQLARRSQPDTNNKNFVRFLSTACGLGEIRIIAVTRVETYLHNHKLMKPAQELLAYLCYNCSASTQRDIEIVSQLSKLRLKNKQMVNFFNNCLREMVISFPENVYPLLKYTIYNELSNTRNTNNLCVVGAMFQVAPEPSADSLADICLELLLNKDDYLRSLRALLKEINRVLRHDFNLLSIVHSLLRERKEITNMLRDSEYKDRFFLSLTDLVSMCMLLSVSPQVRDAASQNKRDVTVLHLFQTQVSNIQREAVTWLHDSAFRIFRPSPVDFHHSLLKVVFLEQGEHYYKVDSWPGENERNLFLRLTSEVPLLQTTLLRILLIGISKDNPLGPSDVLDISDQLIRRAANLAPDLQPALVLDKIEIIDFFFNLCSYNYPENIGLPVGYVPPKLAISALYWKSWLMLLILAAHNPSSIGSLAWSKYPMLRMFMEMCITNHFSFPPPTMLSSEGVDEFKLKEQQMLVLEKQMILEFESHLAAGSTKLEINEQTSLLLPQLMELKPHSEARRPPQHIVDQLQSLNKSHRIGHLLCRSRNPDFLLDIMSRHGGTAHMPWLAELVHSSDGALAHLPVQCLCEYLLSTGPTEKLTKHTQLLSHLRKVVNGNDAQMACEVLEYLLRRLTSLHASNRAPAIKSLTLVLSPTEESELNTSAVDNTLWLTQYILQFPHLSSIRSTLIQFLRQAMLIETNPLHVANYIKFLSGHGMDDTLPELLDLIFDLASLIVERNSIMSYILPTDNMETLKCLLSIFWVYLQKAKEPTDDSFQWSENTDQVIVTWSGGEQSTLQILIVHASIILLTYGPVENFEPFLGLLDLWFPINEEQPKAFLTDTSEEALLVPDWLKLRMIRSNVPRLLDAAVEKLEAPQLVLFIQSFGIPVVSISKLLQVLDRATLADTELVEDSVLDKNYMIQLVDVQNRRGAVGGDIFVNAIQINLPVVNDDDLNIKANLRKEMINIEKSGQSDDLLKEALKYMNKIFNVSSKDIDREVGLLCKIITKEKNKFIGKHLFDYLEKIPPNIILKFTNQTTNCCKLFQLLFSQPYLSAKSVKIATNILSFLLENHCLYKILKNFLKQDKSSTKMEVTESPVLPNDLLKLNLVHDKKSEKLLDCPEHLGEKLARLLIENKNENKTGLLVDWFAAIELEVASPTERKLQMEILFSKENLEFRPLLISTVLQRASWKTLNEILNYLLLPSSVQYNCPSSVLDFLWALTQSPRLWQGRDKAIPKHHQPEEVLHLNSDKIIVIINYILQEASGSDNPESRMEKHLPLIINYMKDHSEAAVKYLVQSSNKEANHFLLLLYMNFPGIEKHFDLKQFGSSCFLKASQSTIDVISHTILSALTSTTKMKDWNRRSQELELCARKLASTHPNLVLRQLPMLAGCLRGRSHFEWNILRSRGHFLLFSQIFGLLELLQPMVFEQTQTLYSILDSYMDLFKFHGQLKELTRIVTRVVTFLQNWMVKDTQNALKYLQHYGYILNDIELTHPCVRPLLSSVSLPFQDSTNSSEQLLIGAPTLPAITPKPPNWKTLITDIKSQDPLNSLQDIDHLSTKRPQLLEDIAQHIFNCVLSKNGQVRSVAINLVVRYVKHNPKASSQALPTILACLNSRDAEITKTILDRLPELITVMQEYAKVILSRVYQLGVNSNLCASTCISKCIAMLSLQSGC